MSRGAVAVARPAGRAAAKPRGGLLDLLLVGLVLAAAWTHTPVGNLVARGFYRVLGRAHSEPALTSYFRVRSAWERVAAELDHPASIPPPAGATGLPEPWRTAAFIVLGRGALPGIDAAWHGDPQAALEVASLGADLRDRAIRRARAAGRAHPEDYSVHREFLPEDARERGDEAVDGVLAIATLLDVQWPVATSFPITSPYGMRVHPVTGVYTLHNGVDIGTPVGTPVHAAQAGTVAVVTEDTRSGRYIVLDHGHGVRTGYCHLSETDVIPGQHVDRGQTIGLSGNTGRTTGPHLHFLVRVHGRTVDPLPLRKAALRSAS